MPGDLPEAGTFCQQFMNQGVMGAAALGHRPGRFGSRSLSRFLSGRVDGPVETTLVPGDALLHSRRQVLPEVESVGDLHCLRRRGAGGFGIGTGPGHGRSPPGPHAPAARRSAARHPGRPCDAVSAMGHGMSIQARTASWSSGVFGSVEVSSTSWVPVVPYVTVNVRLTVPTIVPQFSTLSHEPRVYL